MQYDIIKESTILSYDQIADKQRIDLFNIIGKKCALSDFAILLGGAVSENDKVSDDSSSKGRAGCWYLSKSSQNGKACVIYPSGNSLWVDADCRDVGVRPVLRISDMSSIMPYVIKNKNGYSEVEYGVYPQYAVDINIAKKLDDAYDRNALKTTGKTYTTDSIRRADYTTGFTSMKHEEFEYNGRKYVRVRSNISEDFVKLSNKITVRYGMYVWVEVCPIKWYIDEKEKILISKISLAAGLRICDSIYIGILEDTEMYKFLNTFFVKDLIPSGDYEITFEDKRIEKMKTPDKKINPYNFDFQNVSEEDIIRGAIESGVSVFLHGASSEGKSSRVKQIDPTCEIIYLRNASPDSLNGKSIVMNGEMIDVKPNWLKKVEEKCAKEPNRYHIVFFDEITNALPSIQGIAFNIVLDREVNGIWRLPDNARVVAAGNDMKDSLAANQLAEPLFNRFAHVYIKTTTKSWLKWASENSIHPAIYSFIAFKKGQPLRSKFDGEKPNADPRKWEMASKMLYTTGNPKTLRALVGEDITKEFIEFCNQRVITLEDVLSDNVGDEDIERLNTAEKYATTIGLSQVSEFNLEKVRAFVLKMGAEYETIFDNLWVHGDDSRLERLAEAELAKGDKAYRYEQ